MGIIDSIAELIRHTEWESLKSSISVASFSWKCHKTLSLIWACPVVDTVLLIR